MRTSEHSQILWYRDQVQPFLQELLPTLAEELISDIRRIEDDLQRADEDLTVCFLGCSGVGKSALINALASVGRIVPSGGVGPHTSQAFAIQCGEPPGIEVEYHNRERLLDLLEALENPHDLEEGLGANQSHARYIAEHLITGQSFAGASAEYLTDRLREALKLKSAWGTEASPEDAGRVDRIAALGKVFSAEGQPEQLASIVGEHASGFLAPLVKKAIMRCNSPLLKHGLTLVDLPGLGVVGDPRPEVTRRFIRENAKVLVLVVDHRGVTEPVARLLRESEFLTRLLHTSDAPQESAVLLVAVTKLDDIARSNWRQDRTRDYSNHFAEACESSGPMIQSQLRNQLEALWQEDGGLHESRRDVIDYLLLNLRVHPVSSVEYEALCSAEPCYLKTVEQTNIPALQDSLLEIKKLRAETNDRYVESQLESLRNRMEANLRLLLERQSVSNSEAGQIEQLRSSLESFILPLRVRYAVLEGQYREFLRHTAPQRIADLAKISNQRAKARIDEYLQELSTCHWTTLLASVRRGGRFSGAKKIDLQQEFALHCEEELAQVWGQEILSDVRRRTNQYADERLQIIAEITAWARDHRNQLPLKLVEAQRKTIEADAARLKNIGDDAIRSVRRRSSIELINALDGPIQQQCEHFIREHLDLGKGAKARVMQLFLGLAERVTDVAEGPALRMLSRSFGAIQQDITDALQEKQNPLEVMVQTMLSTEGRPDFGTYVEEVRLLLNSLSNNRAASVGA